MGSKKKSSQSTTATQNTTNTDSSVNASGEDSIALSGGSTLVFNDLSEGVALAALQNSSELAGLVTDRTAGLAGTVAASAFDFVKENARLSAEQNTRLLDVTESTRVGNQQLAADLSRRALELAEKRTGSAEDRAAETVSGLGRIILIAAALGALALFSSRRK
jgi:hypothetical protein